MTEHLQIPSASGTFDAIELGDRGFRAVAPDTRGYSPGVRPMHPDAYGVGELVGDVLTLADTLGWERFDLVGHDWGGAIAWWTAARHAERLRTLTAVSTPHPSALGEAHSTDDDQRRRSQYQQDWRSPDTETRFLADDAALLRSLYQGKDYYRADRPDAAVGRIHAPTLYVWGTEDVPLGSTAAHATEKWVSGPYSFHALQDIGHWVPDEAPEALTSRNARCPARG